jgi:hypothetical protein
MELSVLQLPNGGQKQDLVFNCWPGAGTDFMALGGNRVWSNMFRFNITGREPISSINVHVIYSVNHNNRLAQKVRIVGHTP